MRQLSTAPEHPAPLINPDWSISQDNADPAAAQFQRDLQNYNDQVKEFMAAKAKADGAAKEEVDQKGLQGGSSQKKTTEEQEAAG